MHRIMHFLAFTLWLFNIAMQDGAPQLQVGLYTNTTSIN